MQKIIYSSHSALQILSTKKGHYWYVANIFRCIEFSSVTELYVFSFNEKAGRLAKDYHYTPKDALRVIKNSFDEE